MKVRDLTIITESPQLVGPTDFNLADTESNRKSARELLSKKKDTIEETEDYEIFMTGDGINGYIVLYDKESDLIGYLIKYKEMNKNLIGKTVTQVMLWRMPENPYASGKTKEIFYDVLLKRWPAVMSDSLQTDRGAEFWKVRCADAYGKGYKIGMVDFNDQDVNWYDKSVPFIEWFKDLDVWGPEEKYQGTRLIISN